jgi:hypothetical protein
LASGTRRGANRQGRNTTVILKVLAAWARAKSAGTFEMTTHRAVP